jgi:hypothetical protein
MWLLPGKGEKGDWRMGEMEKQNSRDILNKLNLTIVAV